MKKSKIVTKSDEKKSELDYDAIENEALEYFVWDWINKLPILHADIKRNEKLRKFILPAEAEKVFKPKPFFKFPHQI